MAQTAAEKAEIANETKRLTLIGAYGLDPNTTLPVALAHAANANARTASKARHGAVVEDFETGNALTRAVLGFKVKRAVADLAKSEGRTPNGMKVEPKIVPSPDLPPDHGETAETASA